MPFRLPTRTELGPGSLDRLADIASHYPSGRVLVVTDEGLALTEAPRRVVKLLERAGHRPWVLTEVVPNPRVQDVDAMARAAREDEPPLVVGIGGGSVLDAAKAVALMLRNPGSCRDYEGRNRFEHASAPFVAVPTTCGTGSEVTWVSVLSDTERRTKISVKGDGMFPVWALVDSDLLKTLPPHLVASTGVDALTHAVEAFIGRASNPVSDALAAAAVRLLVEHLPSAVEDIVGDHGAREAVMRASTIAGMAFGNADVGGVHCLSEAIGGRHDLPHGLLNAILLPPVLRYHAGAATGRLEELGRQTGLTGSLVDRIEDLIRRVGIPAFRVLDVPREDFGAIALAAEENGSNASNPRTMAAADYRAILDALAD